MFYFVLTLCKTGGITNTCLFITIYKNWNTKRWKKDNGEKSQKTMAGMNLYEGQ